MTHPEERRLQLGMVGGGHGAYIGAIHRLAAQLDGRYNLVAGAFDIDPERGRAFAAEIGIASERGYGDFEEMVEAEARRDDRVDVVAICTPNHTHYPIARACLERGFHVICEKPLTTSGEDARALADLAGERRRFVGVTYTYCGYPLIHQAREMVAAGRLGRVRVVQVEYPLDWMAAPVEKTNPQAAWRTDPKISGPGGCIGDIGTHAYHLAGFVTGLQIEELCADLATFVPGRVLDDNAAVLLRYEGGARGVLWSSQVAVGCLNGLRLRVFGERGGLAWYQESPNTLAFTPLGEETRLIGRGRDDLAETARVRTRTPPGHPEGYIEAFANLYVGFAGAIRGLEAGAEPGAAARHVPTVTDGVKGVLFIETVVASHAQGGTWVQLPSK